MTDCILFFKRVWLNLHNDGFHERIAAYEGEMLIYALRRMKVVNIAGNCTPGSGEMFSHADKPIDQLTAGPWCNKCHVVIHSPWH